MAEVTKISVTFGRTVNVVGSEWTKFGLTLEAEMEGFEDVDEEIQSLHVKVKEHVRKQIIKFHKENKKG